MCYLGALGMVKPVRLLKNSKVQLFSQQREKGSQKTRTQGSFHLKEVLISKSAENDTLNVKETTFLDGAVENFCSGDFRIGDYCIKLNSFNPMVEKSVGFDFVNLRNSFFKPRFDQLPVVYSTINKVKILTTFFRIKMATFC